MEIKIQIDGNDVSIEQFIDAVFGREHSINEDVPAPYDNIVEYLSICDVKAKNCITEDIFQDMSNKMHKRIDFIMKNKKEIIKDGHIDAIMKNLIGVESYYTKALEQQKVKLKAYEKIVSYCKNALKALTPTGSDFDADKH